VPCEEGEACRACMVYPKYPMGYRSVCHFTISDEMYTFMRTCNSETVGH